MYSLIIKNGLVIDGEGLESRALDVAIDSGQIVNLAPNIKVAAREIIDAAGKVVAPGFIDVQNHSDSYWQLFENPSLGSSISQGFTTLAVGQCGASLAPLINDDSLLPLRKWHGLEGANVNWRNFQELRDQLGVRGLGANVVSFVGYETLRRSFTGDEVRSLTGLEREKVRKLMAESFEQGAGGVSLGLSYSHEWSAPERDLEDVFRLAAEAGKVVAVHLRSEGSHILEALNEVIHLAKAHKAKLKISHFKIRGQGNWLHQEQILAAVERANKDGLSVSFDTYPYDTTWQVLYSYLPHWATSGGRAGLLEQLAKPEQRRKIKDYLSDKNLHTRNLILASTTAKINSIGKAIAEIARGLGSNIEDALLYLIENGGSEVLIFDHNLDPRSVEAFLADKYGLIGSDGAGFPLPGDSSFTQMQNKLVHPRCYGTTARYLKAIAYDQLPAAIKKLTSSAAEALNIKHRGRLAIGYAADVVIFDPKKLEDLATLQNPYQQSRGFEHVLVGGVPVLSHGLVTNDRPGRLLSL